MASGRVLLQRRRKAGAMLILVGLMSAVFSVFAPSAQAVLVTGGTLGDFEIDGNQAATGSNLDWSNVATDDRISEFVVVHDDDDVDLADTSSINGKEQDPSGWTCQETEAPPKDDIFRAYVATQLTAAEQFVHMAFVRGKNVGDTDVNFEFNQASLGFDCAGDPAAAGADRTPGDLLVSFSFPGNAADKAVIDFFEWVEPAPGGADADFVAADGAWVDQGLSASAAAAEDNTDPIADVLFGNAAVDSRDFGEATIDLEAALGDDVLGCPGFGHMNIHSRASHTFSSDLKDIFPETPIDLSNCARLVLKKVDDAGEPMEGIQFGLFASEEDAEAGTPLAQLPGVPPLPDQDLTCTTGSDGVCVFAKVPPGTYYINEIDPPAGYTPDPDLPKMVTLAAFDDLDLSDDDNEACAGDVNDADCEWFVNTRDVEPPNVGVEKTTSDASVDAGDGVDFSITLTNHGEVAATASFTDDLPDEVVWSFDGTPPDGCVLDGSNDLVCTDVAIGADSSVTIDLVGTTDPAACPSITNPEFTITVPGEPEELDDDNTTDPVVISVGCPDVGVDKTTSDASVTAGDGVDFTITLANDGDAAATASFTDDLPNGVVWSFAGTPPDGCVLNGSNDLVCTDLAIGAGSSVTIELVGVTDRGDCPSITNPSFTITVPNEPESLAGDNTTDPVTITVTCPPPPPPPPSPIDISIVKDGPDLAHRGDEITYDFTVTNTGDVNLVTVVLTDPICDDGTIELVDDGNGDTTLAVDEVWTYECTRVITDDDPDPLPNTATVQGTDAQGRTTTDDDDHLVDLIAPAIEVVKTVDDDAPEIGQTVTFTYVVTNIGDTTLFDVAVVDDQLGAIGTIEELEAGASATLTATMEVAADSPIRNVALASGEDVLGEVVTDDDDAVISIVLPAVIPRPAPVVKGEVLPRTGGDLDMVLVMGIVLILVGTATIASANVVPRPVRSRRES